MSILIMMKTRKTFIIIFNFLLLFINTSFAISDSNSTQELSDILQSTKTLKANFTQTVSSKNKILTKITGNIAIKKPKLFLWETKEPELNLIIIDGKKFWNYDEELQQVTVQGIEDSYSSSPIGLFLSANFVDINERYNVHKLSNNRFELTPKDDSEGFKEVELKFKSNIIDSLILKDQLEQVSKIKFTNVQTNINLSDKLFIFNPPEGVDVIGE